jgi:hypothetical protein
VDDKGREAKDATVEAVEAKMIAAKENFIMESNCWLMKDFLKTK